MKIYIDGQLFPKEDAKISVFDHGLLYGDGVFEEGAAGEGVLAQVDAPAGLAHDVVQCVDQRLGRTVAVGEVECDGDPHDDPGEAEYQGRF